MASAELLYLTPAETTEAAIRARQLARLPADLSTIEGSFPRDPIDASTPEFAQVAVALDRALDLGFAETTFGSRLEQRVSESGLERLGAVAATGTLRFTGTVGTAIPLGTRVATAATTQTAAQVFATTAAAEVGAGGTVDVAAAAEVGGTAGNVAAGQLVFLLAPITGITGVTNPSAATGGTDEETDAALLARYLQAVRSPSAGGNRADYTNWALAVPGVGGVAVSFPGEGSPAVADGNVRLSLVGSDKAPASLAVQDAVLNDIVDPRRHGPYEAEAFAISGFGVTVDATQADDSGDSLKLVHNASGDGQAAHASLHTLLEQAGISMVKVRAKVDSVAGVTPFFRVGVWSTAQGDWARSSPGAAYGTAVTTYAADDLATAFGDGDSDLDWLSVDFYWDGVEALELRLQRLVADTVTQVWVDQVRYRSAFSSSEGGGRVPAGSRMRVQAAVPVTINVAATLEYEPGADEESVDDSVASRLDAYLKSLAFADDNDVSYARVGVEILDTPGVADYTGLTVNGGAVNIPIGVEQVAVLGTTP